MEKVVYHDPKKFGFPFYLCCVIVFASLLVCHIVSACLVEDALLRNQSILVSVTSVLGTVLSAFGLLNVLRKGKIPHAFFLSGMMLSLLSLSLLLETILPVMMDPKTGSLTGWGIVAVIFLSILVADGIVGCSLPKHYLFIRKMLLILGMTLLIAIYGIAFVAKVIDLANRGLGVGNTALLSLLNAYTYLVPLASLGVGIAFLLEVTQEELSA